MPPATVDVARSESRRALTWSRAAARWTPGSNEPAANAPGAVQSRDRRRA